MVDGVEHDAYELSAGARTPAQAYPAINQTLFDAGDAHSMIESSSSSGSTAPTTLPTGVLRADHIGKIVVPPVVLERSFTTYAQHMQLVIRSLEMRGACRWIVDLRTDTGGNLWSMLAGLAPLFTPGVVGYSVGTPGERRLPWTITAHGSDLDGVTQVSVASPAASARGPVAILTGPLTASSGEGVVIAFAQQAHTRTFGAPTYGVPNARSAYTVPGGATLELVTASDADRSGHVYPFASPLQPDQTTSASTIDRSDQTPSSDTVAARSWLAAQTC